MSCCVKKQVEVIPQGTRSSISSRYKTVTRAINREIWNIQSETQHSFYVGSYGRGTAIDTSDIDILVELPYDEYNHFNSLKGNGQSRLLQTVRNAIKATYPKSDISADGQVVKIDFSDGMKFEILPAFKTLDGTYIYPDTNMGGNWSSTNPKAEQSAMVEKNRDSNGLLYDTCKHIRRIRDEYFRSYHLSGIVIDSFVYVAMRNWRWPLDGETFSSKIGDYEIELFIYFCRKWLNGSHLAPGSNQSVDIQSSIDCMVKVMKYIAVG